LLAIEWYQLYCRQKFFEYAEKNVIYKCNLQKTKKKKICDYEIEMYNEYNEYKIPPNKNK